MPVLDPAVQKALSLDPDITKISSYGSSGFATTYKITTSAQDGSSKIYFMKTGNAASFRDSVAGEHASLNAIHEAVPDLCPASLAHGELENGQGHFLVTEFIEMHSGSSSGGRKGTRTLAQKLAELHSKTAPVPDGHSQPMYGFPVPTFCGATAMENTFSRSWSGFFAEQRMRGILRSCEATHGKGDSELRAWVEKTAAVVVPRLLREGHLGGSNGIAPVVVHGDLWSGNKTTGTIASSSSLQQTEEHVFDPSSFYAHSEYELGIMGLFGGFGGAFMKEYHGILPKTEPVEEYEDRVLLYESWHLLNHYNLFGGGYRSQALNNLKSLWRKYGDAKSNG
jgi:protein-ribulosamine 3-kinase